MSSRILIVEDEALVASELEMRLSEMGYQVCGVVDNAEDALEEVGRSRPDLVLLDIRIRGSIDGVQLAEYLKRDWKIPFLFLTAHSDPVTLVRAGNTEPLGYLLKPLRPRELHAAVEMALYRHQAETRHRKMERWLATALDSIGDAVIATDLDGRISFMNPIAQNLTGWSAREAIGLHYADVFQLIEETTGQPGREVIEQCLTRGVCIHLDEGFCIRNRQGTLIPIDDSIAPIRDDESLTGLVIIFRDRSRRKKLEQERLSLERQMFESQRLDTLGMMAAGVAHDFNNLLAIIRGNTEMCSQSCSPEQAEYLDEIQLAVSRASDLCSQMLTYAGRGPLEKRSVDLFALLESTFALVRRLRGKVTYEVSRGAGHHAVAGDPRQLQQLLLNLLLNAADAVPEEDGHVHVHLSLQDNEIVLEVKDNGCGIHPEHLDAIFEPFFTTKQQGRGLGLAASAGVVRSHGGTIRVESQIGEGTKFYIGLPALPASQEASTDVTSAAPPEKKQTTVLVVDDEESLRRLLVKVLQREGFQVHEACNGQEALDMCEERGEAYDLVVLDIVMPVLGGFETRARLLEMYPSLPLLMISGYHDQAAMECGEFLSKPFQVEAFREKVRLLLGVQ